MKYTIATTYHLLDSAEGRKGLILLPNGEVYMVTIYTLDTKESFPLHVVSNHVGTGANIWVFGENDYDVAFTVEENQTYLFDSEIGLCRLHRHTRIDGSGGVVAKYVLYEEKRR